jgi:hypothetical protein
MWVRAVAVAMAVACCAVTAQAAQYSEVWNPPEAAHPVKRGKGHTGAPAAARKIAAKGAVGGTGKRQQGAPLKEVASVHAARETRTHFARQAMPHVRVGATDVSGRSAHAGTVKMSGREGASNKPIKTAHSSSGHVQMAAVHPKATQHKQQKLAAEPVSTQPASTMASVAPRPAPAQPVATMADTAARPVTQNSNLPPILH